MLPSVRSVAAMAARRMSIVLLVKSNRGGSTMNRENKLSLSKIKIGEFGGCLDTPLGSLSRPA